MIEENKKSLSHLLFERVEGKADFHLSNKQRVLLTPDTSDTLIKILCTSCLHLAALYCTLM